MLYRDKNAVYSDHHTRHTNGLCGPKKEFLNFREAGTYTDYSCVLNMEAKIPEKLWLIFLKLYHFNFHKICHITMPGTSAICLLPSFS